MGGKPAFAVAPERLSNTATQNAFVGRHPVHTELVGDGDGLVRDAAFAWPHALGTEAKYFFVQIETAQDLVAGIFRMAETILRQGQTRRRDGADVCVAE